MTVPSVVSPTNLSVMPSPPGPPAPPPGGPPAALAVELTKVGATIVEHPDGLEITPGPLRATGFETYADHRMAHAAAVVGLAVEGIVLSDVACTSKTLPEFPELWARLVTRS